jgi:hypothetical protein
MARRISSRSSRQRLTRSALLPMEPASSTARSSATQPPVRSLGDIRNKSRGRRRQRTHLLPQPVQRAQELAVHVELTLGPGSIADPDRAAPAPAAEVRQLTLGQVALPVHGGRVGLVQEIAEGIALERPQRLSTRTAGVTSTSSLSCRIEHFTSRPKSWGGRCTCQC